MSLRNSAKTEVSVFYAGKKLLTIAYLVAGAIVWLVVKERRNQLNYKAGTTTKDIFDGPIFQLLLLVFFRASAIMKDSTAFKFKIAT